MLKSAVFVMAMFVSMKALADNASAFSCYHNLNTLGKDHVFADNGKFAIGYLGRLNFSILSSGKVGACIIHKPAYLNAEGSAVGIEVTFDKQEHYFTFAKDQVLEVAKPEKNDYSKADCYPAKGAQEEGFWIQAIKAAVKVAAARCADDQHSGSSGNQYACVDQVRKVMQKCEGETSAAVKREVGKSLETLDAHYPITDAKIQKASYEPGDGGSSR